MPSTALRMLPAVRGDERKGDDAPDLRAAENSAECQPDTDGLVDKQLDGQHKDLPAHQNVGQIRDAEAAVFALQLVEPIVHIGCLQRIVFRYR